MKRSKFNNLIRLIINETIASMDNIGSTSDPTDPLTQTLNSEPDQLSPIEQQKRERELRKSNRSKLQSTQKIKKLETDKKKAEDKTWKLKRKNLDKTIQNLKRSGV